MSGYCASSLAAVQIQSGNSINRSKVALEVPMKAAEIGNMAAKPSAPMATKAHDSRRGHADQEQEMRDDKDAGRGESRARGWNRR
jgi:hypothetical protein